MRNAIAIIVCSFGLATAAAAQTTTPATPPAAGKSAAECTTSWRALDKNSDGRLDKAEMDANKAMVPSSMASAASATQTEFLAACEGKPAGSNQK